MQKGHYSQEKFDYEVLGSAQTLVKSPLTTRAHFGG